MMRYGLIGGTLGHSYSPEIHQRLRGYDYALCPLAPEALPGFFARRAFEGINVTIPYKKEVIPYCDARSETARRSGSVNTIIKQPDGSLFGDNTDLQGFQFMLKRAGISLCEQHVLILGNGGSSQTVQLAAADAGAKSIQVVGRNDSADCPQAQVIVNATPVGMFPHSSGRLVDLAHYPKLEAAADLIYNPLRTRFLQQAEQLGLITANGLPMLVAQAAASAALFTGIAQGESDVERVLSELQRNLKNWVLIGMPGCGKSTVGAWLAKKSGRIFVDLDNEIETRMGIPPAEIILRMGEAAFRDMEREVTAEFGAKTGLVIAAGGGTVLREENVQSLRQNGRLLWIQRGAAHLPTEGRPLSVNLNALLQKRMPAYEYAADTMIQHEEDWDILQEHALEVFAS